MNNEELMNKIIEVIKSYRFTRKEIAPDTKLIEQLEIEVMDLNDIIIELEDLLEIEEIACEDYEKIVDASEVTVSDIAAVFKKYIQ